MAGSVYLTPEDYGTYGLDTAVATETKVRAASQLIDAYLGRPQGLVWVPDALGNPCYMSSPAATQTLKSTGAILPGTSVVVPFTGPGLDGNSVGEVVILDTSSKTLVEACVIQALSPGVVTLQSVTNSHAPSCTMDLGLTIMEERELPAQRSIARVAQFPITRLLSGVGRYGYGRRGTQIAGNMQEFNLLAVVSNFGGPPLWIPWTVTNASVSFRTGEIWVPAGVLLDYFTDVRIWYIAGFSASGLPSNIKQACANIILLGKETGLGANIRSRGMRESTTVSKWENNMIDKNTREILDPFKARRFV